jgi:hypothetical protein
MDEPRFLSLRRGHRRPTRQPTCEPLELRIALSVDPGALTSAIDLHADDDTLVEPLHHEGTHYPGGVLVTDTTIFTESETIPRFVAQPTISAVRDGLWGDPNTWSLGRVPTSGDRVSIPAGRQVIVAEVNSARLNGLEVSGSLLFWTTVNTRLIVGNLTVMPNGHLYLGLAGMVVDPSVKAELVIADQPLNLTTDPRQYGTGLIVLGEFSVRGAPVASTWLRLAAEPKAGDTSLLLSQSVPDWKPGDRLALPDTRQVETSEQETFIAGGLTGQGEEMVIDRVVGNRVFLTKPLAFDHLGARNTSGVLELLPHVALLSRNVVIRSENPNGTRGHTLYTARANVDIRYADFQDLGRTDAFRNLDSSTFNAAGNATHLGTNQVGRYAVHLHHMPGPDNPTNTGYQFEFVGNTVERSRKWAIATHDTSYGLLDHNVVYRAQGAGFVTEDGSEIENVFSNNITMAIHGTHVDGQEGTATGDYGRGGVGFWFRRGGNAILGNVAADNTYAGFVFSGYNSDEIVLPAFRGAEKHEEGQGFETQLSPETWFLDNEAYGMMRYGVWAAFVAGSNSLPNQPQTLVQDLRLWHFVGAGVQAYHTAAMTFERLTILGSLAAWDRNDTGPVGMSLSVYENNDLTVRNSRIEGMYIGVVAPTNDATQAGVERPTVIRNSTLKNYNNIVVSPPLDNRPTHGSVLEVRDVKFQLLAPPPGPSKTAPAPMNIRMGLSNEALNLVQPSIVRVYNYNQVKGVNFQVFYFEQSRTYVLPQTPQAALSSRAPFTIGSPLAGFTNQQNWALFGIAMGGSVAPTNATASRPEIHGLIAPIQNLAAITPRVVLLTPWDGASVQGNSPVRIRYNVNGIMPAGAQVYFQIDGGPRFTEPTDGGVWGVPPGQHQLVAFIGDSQGRELAGTVRATSFLEVSV